MLVDLVIDGNFLLNKLVFTLHKNNLLFGALGASLDGAISGYRKWYPFANIYLVSDSKEKSWRKKIHSDYKGTRKKDNTIDWEFVFTAYNEFKDDIRNRGVKILEAPEVEGDDWISYLVEKSNSAGRSVLIISNDYDIKQLVYFSLDPLFINFMSNELFNKQKLFLPKNYQMFLSSINKLESNDIFNLNDNNDFVNLMKSFIDKYEIHEVSYIESLVVKLISGDSSDNIPSVWSIVKNGRKRGIAEKGAKSIYDEYLINWGEPNLNDKDLAENIADLICEKKRLSKSNIKWIEGNINFNMKLILLDTSQMPEDILERMDFEFEKIKK